MNIVCAIPNRKYNELVSQYEKRYGKKLNIETAYGYIGFFQAQHKTLNVPTVTDLHTTITRLNGANVELATPVYNNGSNKALEAPDTISYYSGNIKSVNSKNKVLQSFGEEDDSTLKEETTVFVFGSNPEGKHGAGAAKIAVENWGAVEGVGEGLQGNSYAIPTKDLKIHRKGTPSIPKKDVISSISKMYKVAKENPNKTFKVAYRNTANERTLNEYTGAEMAEMFRSAGKIPGNVQFSKEWVDEGLITSADYEETANSVRYITADNKGNITLYKFRGLTLEAQLDSFWDFVENSLYESYNEETNYSVLEQAVKESTFKSFDKFKEVFKNIDTAERFLLWYQQGINMRKMNNKSPEDNHKKALKEAIEKTYKFIQKHGINSAYKPILSGVDFVKVTDTKLISLHKDFTVEQINNRVSDIARKFQDAVEDIRDTYIEDIENKLEELASQPQTYTTQKTIKDLQDELEELNSNHGLVYVCNMLGMDNLKQEIKDFYLSYLEDFEDDERREYELKNRGYVKITLKREHPDDYDVAVSKYISYKLDQYQRVVKHFDVLFNQSFAEIYERTGVKLSAQKAVERENTNDDGDIITQIDTEKGESYKDGYLIKARETNPVKTLSKEVKALLGGIKAVDSSGKAKFDDLGNFKTLTSSRVYSLLLIEANNLLDVDDFGTKDNPIKFLEKVNKKYKWAKQIINRVTNEDGTYDLKTLSALYSAISLQFQPFYYVRDDFMSPMNKITGVNGVIDSVRNNLSLGIALTSNPIYDEDGNISKTSLDKTVKLWDSVKDRIKGDREADYLLSLSDDDEKEYKKILKNIATVLQRIGINTEASDVDAVLRDSDRLKYFTENVVTSVNYILKRARDLEAEESLFDNNMGNYTKIVNAFGLAKTEGIKMSAWNAGRMKYSFSARSYLDKIMKNLSQDAHMRRLGRPARGEEVKTMFTKFLEEEFEKDGFFFDKFTGKYKSPWLRWLKGNEKGMREKFTHIQLDSIDGIPYRDWTPKEIIKAIKIAFENRNYNKDADKDEDSKNFAYYHMPIFSNSPAMIFIRAPKITENFEEEIVKLLTDVVYQEIYRISRIIKRGELIKAGDPRVQPIVNYDITYNSDGSEKSMGGAEFKFFPQLNDGSFYETINNLLLQGKMNEATKVISQRLSTLMEEGYNEVKGTFSKECFYNSVLATSQIIQLTTTDLAFYQNLIDFQKRFKEVYASGTRLNTNSKYGKKVKKTITLKDKELPSLSLRYIDDAIQKNPGLNKIDKDFIKSNFNRINTTNAQAFLTPEAFRSILDMMGKWTDEMETALEHFLQGNWDMKDFMVIWQTIKPFMYTQKFNNTYVEGDEFMKTPLQQKDSEAMLTSFLGLVSGKYSESPTLNGLTTFMRKYDIDSAIFESGVKVGGHSAVDLNYSRRYLKEVLDNGGKVTIGSTSIMVSDYDDFVKKATDLLTSRKVTQEEFNDALIKWEIKDEEEVVEILSDVLDADPSNNSVNEDKIDTVSYEDMMIAQVSDEHLVEADSASFGSQFANLILADLPSDFSVTLNGKDYNGDELKQLYYNLRVENIADGAKEVEKIFGSIEELQKHLRSAITSKQGVSNNDLLNAIEIVKVENPYTGEVVKKFNIPPYTPVIAQQLNSVIMSVFRNKVTKQTISGGNATMVSNWGYTDELKLERDKDGNIIGIQCYLPAYAKEFYEVLMDADGKLDISKIKDPELLKVIGYRIPTEAKYSMIPLIVKGFLPQQNGSTIMVAHEFIEMSGADFDIDKIYLMTPNFRVRTKMDRRALRDHFMSNPRISEWSNSEVQGMSESKYTNKIDAFLDRLEAGEDFEEGSVEEAMAREYLENKDDFTKTSIERVKYDFTKSPRENSKEARDNLIIELSFKTLISPSIASSLFSRGNFDNVTRGAHINRVAKSKVFLNAYMKEKGIKDNDPAKFIKIARLLMQEEDDVLADIIKKNDKSKFPLSPMVFPEAHSSYTTGGSMVGPYAIASSFIAKTQNLGMEGSAVSGAFSSDTGLKKDLTAPMNRGTKTTSNAAQWIAASVDDAKYDNLRHLNQKPRTAKYSTLLTMYGMSPEEIGILVTNDSFMNSKTDKKAPKIRFTVEVILTDTIHKTLTGNPLFDKTTRASLANHRMAISKEATDLKRLITAYRADSASAAASPTIGGNIMQILRKEIADEIIDKYSTIKTFGDAFVPTLRSGKSINELADECMKSKMPMLTAFYNFGIAFSRKVLGDYAIGYNDTLGSVISTIVKESGRADIADETANKIVNHFVIYQLSKTKIFGDDERNSAASKRRYYLNNFAQDLKRTIRKNKELQKNDFIRALDIKGKNIKIVGPSQLNDTTVSRYKRSANSLFYSEEGSNIALSLLLYSYYKTGLQFTYNSVSSYILTTEFLINFPDIVEALRFMSDAEFDAEDAENFMSQVYNNIPLDDFAKTVKYNSVSKVTGTNMYSVSLQRVLNPLENPSTIIKTSNFITGDVAFYKLVEIAGDKAYYKRIKPATVTTIPQYSYKDDIIDLNEEEKDNEVEEADIFYNPGSDDDYSEEDLDEEEDTLEEQDQRYSPEEGNKTLDEKLCMPKVPKGISNLLKNL